MQLTEQDRVLVTGATGLVGSHVAEAFRNKNIPVRVLVRDGSDTNFLDSIGVEKVLGDLSNAESLTEACRDVTVVVHCAAKVGDWGPTEDYREINVRGVEKLIAAAKASGKLARFVHISSLGVYEARDHHGTDESEPPSKKGIDGYTLTKVESEEVVREAIAPGGLPGVVLRPGFIYGPRDRTVLPRLIDKIASKKFKYLGTTEKLMNNTFVGNLVEAVLLAVERDDVIGEVFNIRDPRLVSKSEFMNAVADEAGIARPEGTVPLPVAKGLATVLEGLWKLLGKKEAPILSSARIKFLALNLDYSIDKAKAELGYEPSTDFKDAMKQTIAWFDEHDRFPPSVAEARAASDESSSAEATA